MPLKCKADVYEKHKNNVYRKLKGQSQLKGPRQRATQHFKQTFSDHLSINKAIKRPLMQHGIR